MKRWIALILTMSIALSDCGSIAVFAAEDAATVETSDSGNDEESLQTEEDEDIVSDELPENREPISEDETENSEDVDFSPIESDGDQNHAGTDSAQDEGKAPEAEVDTASETDVETETEADTDTAPVTETASELPALHIGQINKGEELPLPDDSEFVYDLPVSFEMSDSVLLFVNYNMDTTFEQEEKGTLVWSILRGENGMEEGSVSLVNEEDDWADFEVVPDSPFFTMTENEDEESDYYQTVELAAVDLTGEGDREESKDYNYYIRAAWYFGTGEEMAEEFYAAATVAFLPGEDTDIDGAQDDTLGAEEIDTEETIEAEEIDAEEAIEVEEIDAEETLDAEEIDTEETQGDVPVTEETFDKETEDDELLEESYMSTALEEDDVEGGTDEVFEDDEQQNLDEQTRRLILDVSAETPIEMYPGATRQVTATVVSVDIPEETQDDTTVDPAKIVWESSDKTVAAVDKGLISAKAEGYALITAQYDGLTASVMVEVVQEDGEQILDLSGDIWVAGFQQESEDFVYTGQKITQDIRVYHNETLLKEKTDYTLTYKNNVNAAVYNSAKAPSVTINLKGQYSGSRTLYFTIQPRNIDEDGTMGYEQVVQYANTLKIPAPTLYYHNRKLTSNKDFVCDYTDYDESSEYSRMPEDYKKGDSYEAGKIYAYTVCGTGNFKGSFKMRLVVVKDKNLNLGSATITLDRKQYEYHGKPLSKDDVGITVKFGKTVVDGSCYEYKVHAEDVGTGYVEIQPSGTGREAGYRGTKKVNIKVVGDRQIQYAVTVDGGWQPEIVFSQKSLNENGGMIQAATGVLVYPGEGGSAPIPLEEGQDYTVKYSNHKKVGTATATFTGMGRYTGTLKIKYKITPNNGKGKDGNFTITWKNVTRNVTDEGETFEIAYQKGGAVPDFALMDQDKNILKNKTDYTVKLTDNKTAGSIMTCVITGKGNYNGYSVSKQIKVTPADIGKGTISVADKQYSTKADAWKSKPTLKDANGKTLTAGTDYARTFDYVYDNMANGEPPEAGAAVTITVHGINNYDGSVITGSYRIYKTNISKLKITIDAQEYTGKEITLTPIKDIHVYATGSDQKKKKDEIKDDCYKIIEYKNNVKAGTAKVTLQGIGAYGGTKTYSFKISKKKYLINQVKGITLDPTGLSLSLQGKDDEKRILTANIKSADATESLANPTVIWSSSNSNIVAVEGREIVETKVPGNPATIETTVTAHITIKKAGSVTITATTQDGNKKAKCTVTIVDVPILEDEGRIIKMNVGDTYQLKFENDESQQSDLSGITWTISNSNVVSVDKEKRLLTAKKAGAAVLKLTKGKYVQQCYVIVEGEEEDIPGNYLKFTQKSDSDDDTEDIRNCIKTANHTKTDDGTFMYDGVYIPAGVYRIDATANAKYGIFLDGRDKSVTWDPLEERESFEIRLSPGALLMAIGNKSTTYHVITICGCKNITISGGTIIGERNEHTGKGGEWGHGIGIYDSTNIQISGMDISQCWGDGIYLGTNENTSNRGIKITNCNAHDNRRNNLSITSANGVTIDNCQFNYAKGTDPQFGIDIETNNNSRPCKNITISNTTIKGNAKGSMGIITNAKNVTLEDCTLSGNFYNQAGKNVVLRRVKFESGSVIDNAGGVTIVK